MTCDHPVIFAGIMAGIGLVCGVLMVLAFSMAMIARDADDEDGLATEDPHDGVGA